MSNMAAASVPPRLSRVSRLSHLSRLSNGLGWMVLAQVFFAAMNVCAYSLARAAPVTAMSGLSIVFTYLLAIPVFGDQPTASQAAGSFLVIVASLLLTVRPAPALS